jgi:hypothetical protein
MSALPAASPCRHKSTWPEQQAKNQHPLDAQEANCAEGDEPEALRLGVLNRTRYRDNPPMRDYKCTDLPLLPPNIPRRLSAVRKFECPRWPSGHSVNSSALQPRTLASDIFHVCFGEGASKR